MQIQIPPRVGHKRSNNRKCLKSSIPYKLDSKNTTDTLNTYPVFPGYGHRLPEGVI